MCGRYTLSDTKDMKERFSIQEFGDFPNLESDYNVAPGKIMPVVTHNSPNSIKLMKWGLIPSWAKDPKIGYKMINARADSMDKPSFKKPFKSQRCLIPANGFYEWQKTASEKVPFYIKLKSSDLFAFAGLYDVWTDAEGIKIYSYTIITTEPNEIMKPIHNRMPVILSKDEEEIWLNQDSKESDLLLLLDSYPSNEMEAYTVSSEVNSPRNNSHDLLRKVS